MKSKIMLGMLAGVVLLSIPKTREYLLEKISMITGLVKDVCLERKTEKPAA